MGFTANLSSEAGIYTNILRLQARYIETSEDSFRLSNELAACADALAATPDFISPRILEELTALALASPFRDIHDPGALLHHAQTPAQDAAIYATREFYHLARALGPDEDKVINCLAHIARASKDWDVRNQALTTLRVLGDGRDRLWTQTIAAVLEKQALENDNSYLRIAAREAICDYFREKNPELRETVLRTLQAGALDADSRARAQAYGSLATLVQTANGLQENDLKKLREFFIQAAQGFEETPVRDTAAYGLKKTVERLARPGFTAPFPPPSP